MTYIQFGNEGKTPKEEKNDRDMLYAFSCIYKELRRHVFFLFLILDAKISKFTNVKFEKNDIKLKNSGP